MAIPYVNVNTAELLANTAQELAIDAALNTLLTGSTGTIADYSSLFSAAFRAQPNMSQWINVLCEPMVTNATLLASLPAKFDLGSAVGQQLDYTGQWIGRTRLVTLPGPPPTVVSLSDSEYRLLLAAGVLDNQWNGTIPSAYTIYQSIFPPGSGPYVFIQDLTNMEMMVGLGDSTGTLDATTVALFNSGALSVKPVGVRVHYATPSVTPAPFFSFDLNTSQFAGFDTGVWATITPP